MEIKALTQAATPLQFSSLELMSLIFKITALFEKASNAALDQKRKHLSIFETESKNHSSLKGWEGSTMVVLSLATGALQLGGTMTPSFARRTLGFNQEGCKFVKNAASAAAACFSTLTNQAAPSLFGTYSLSHDHQKQMAQTETEAAKNMNDTAERELQKSLETLGSVLRQLSGLNHTR